MRNLKTILLTSLGVVVLIVSIVGFFIFKTIFEKWDQLTFAYNHPNLVSAMREQYKIEMGNLEQKFIVREKSADDKLKEALVNELEGSKEGSKE